MKEFFQGIARALLSWRDSDSPSRKFFGRLWDPACSVGNKKRVRKIGEADGDAGRLHELNVEWRNMLREDEWTERIAPFGRLFSRTFALAVLGFIVLNTFAKSAGIFYFLCVIALIISAGGGVWVCLWQRRIEKRVFEKFKARFGKHFHLY